MNLLQKLFFFAAVPPEAQDDGPLTNNAVDTLGLKELGFLISAGDLQAAVGSGDDSTALRLEQAEEAGGSYADVPGSALSAPIGADKDGKLFFIAVDLAKTHRRFIRVKNPTVGDGAGDSLVSIIALAVPAWTPQDAADAGCEERVLA